MKGPTPGPWWYQEKSDAYTHIVRAGENRFVCQLSNEANARLIAAAPETAAELERAQETIADLLKALTGISDISASPSSSDTHTRLHAALDSLDRARKIARMAYDAAISRATPDPDSFGLVTNYDIADGKLDDTPDTGAPK